MGNGPPAVSKTDWNALANEAFRSEVRSFFEEHYPSHLRYPKARLRWHQIREWTLTLSRKGWIAPAWPVEYGGMGLAPEKLIIFYEEQELWGVGRAPDMGITMIGPLLIKYGSEAHRREFLPPIIACEHIWCQGYSEPGAGSDLASLHTEALLDGEEFVLNGQKTWTSHGLDATHMFLLARTDKSVKKQQGISFLLADMNSPGITVRPIRNIAGHDEFCEVFLENVRVPKTRLVGEMNQGWTLAKALLGFERIMQGSPKQSQYVLGRLEELAVRLGLDRDMGFIDRFTQLRLDVADLGALYIRFVDQVKRGEPLGADVSILKVWGSETASRLASLLVEAAGSAGATVGDVELLRKHADILTSFYNARPSTIYGGSNEIQRNILAAQVLGLPN